MINEKKAILLSKKKKLTKDDLELLKEFLEYCSSSYYNTDKLVIDDTKYDYIYNKYLDAGGEEIMGAKPEKGTINSDHHYQTLVGTTLKAHTLEDFNDWIDGVYKNLNLSTSKILKLYVTLKFDGNSILIEYNKDGTVRKALTRGRNGQGKDLTFIFKDFCVPENVLNQYSIREEFAIKYEALIYYENLEKFNASYKKDYKNPRAAISGLLNSDDGDKYTEYYTLEPLWMKLKDGEISRETEMDFFYDYYRYNDDYSANTEYLYEIEGNLAEIKNDIINVYEDVISIRNNLDFMIDGIVIDVVNKDLREKLGYITGGENLKPKWCVALKFPYMSHESHVTKMEFTLGDSGKISPVCYFEPVKFNGTTHIKQYLQGYGRYQELQLGIGSRIIVEYHNDTLTYITKPLDCEDDDYIKPIPFIDHCPVCGSPIVLNKNKQFAYCSNDFCEGKAVGMINNFVTTMDIKGIKTSTIQKLYDAGFWKTIPDMYQFCYNEKLQNRASNIEGLGASSITKITKAIRNKKYYDYEIIGSLGIPNFKLNGAKALLNEMSLEDVINFIENDEQEEFTNKAKSIEGIGDILADNIFNRIYKHLDLVKFLMDKGYKKISDENNFDDVRYTFVVTGDLVYCDRGKLKDKLEKRGHKLVGSVSSKTDYLVTNTPDSGTVKNKKAKELGKSIITEDELYDMLNLDK